MKKIAVIAFTALAAGSTMAASTSLALAHSNEARQSEQADWIEQGRRDGSITWSEGLRLRREQAQIEHTKNALAADGSLSRSDRQTVYRLQDNAQADISHEANDGWHRWWWLPRFGR